MKVGWKDNKAVYLASNQHGPEPVGQCGRFSKASRGKVQVPCPNLVKTYNQGMGGVDQMDSSVALYRVGWRKRKWWWPMFSWSLDVQAVNAWRLRQLMTGHKDSFLKFLRELVVGLLTEHGTKPAAARSTSGLPPSIRDHVRYSTYLIYLPTYIHHVFTGLTELTTGLWQQTWCRAPISQGRGTARGVPSVGWLTARQSICA